jgi:rhamnogalacturonan endolyase
MAQRQMERLDRGLVAAKSGNTTNAFVSWRLFATDPTDVKFSVYRATSATGAFSLVSNCSGLDAAHTNCTVTGGAGTGDRYQVAVLVNGAEVERSKAVAVWQTTAPGSNGGSGAYLEIPVQKPMAKGPNGGNYTIYDGVVADLDGDGEYEIVFFWAPDNMQDNSNSGVTDDVYIDTYKLNGTKLWGAGKYINLGPNIRAGAHYQTFLVYDFDGNGKAEIIVKTADGTTDTQGTRIGNNTIYRNASTGYILTGNEYITVFEGATGKIIDTKPFEVARGTVGDWGDTYGNRVDRFLSTVAYLDGKKPSAVMWRGYYGRTTASAWDFNGRELVRRWVFDSKTLAAADRTRYEGQGNHNLSVAELNGRDIIITGAIAIDGDGKPLFSNGTKHGDAMHLAKHIPNRIGLQVFRCLENSPWGVQMYDAATGTVIWNVGDGSDTGRALCADIDPDSPGSECWGSGGVQIYSATGTKLGNKPSNLSVNMSVWWTGETSRETWDGAVVKVTASGTAPNKTYTRTQLVTHDGTTTIGGTKKNPVLQADILGDWREEIIVPTINSSALRIYTTTMPTVHTGAGAIPSQGIPTLMQNKMYRLAVTWQHSAYNQPPWVDYFLGYGMGQVPRDNIVYVGSGSGSSSSAAVVVPSSSSAAVVVPSSSSAAVIVPSSSSATVVVPSSSSVAGLVCAGVIGEKFWNFSANEFMNGLPFDPDNQSNNITESYTINGLTIVYDNSAMSYNENNKSIDDYDFSYRFQLGGTGSTTNRALKFDVDGNATISVYAIAGTSGVTRALALSNGTTELQTINFPGAAISRGDYTYTGAASTLYLYSKSSGINIYGVKVQSCGNATPIVLPKFTNSSTLNAMQNAVNLYAANETVIKIFNLKGNAVRTMRFTPGNYVVPLNDLPKGMYIVKASNASWQETIKVNVVL